MYGSGVLVITCIGDAVSGLWLILEMEERLIYWHRPNRVRVFWHPANGITWLSAIGSGTKANAMPTGALPFGLMAAGELFL